MKNIYSLLATLAMLFSMPALASSLMERVAEADCQDPEFRAQFTEEELGLALTRFRRQFFYAA